MLKHGRIVRWMVVVATIGLGSAAVGQRLASSNAAGENTVWAGKNPTVVASSPAPAAGGLDWRILENPKGPHTALIFDPVRQVFAVYHVDSASGRIMLKAVRSLSADLRLEQYNSKDPAPSDIESMLNEAR